MNDLGRPADQVCLQLNLSIDYIYRVLSSLLSSWKESSTGGKLSSIPRIKRAETDLDPLANFIGYMKCLTCSINAARAALNFHWIRETREAGGFLI